MSTYDDLSSSLISIKLPIDTWYALFTCAFSSGTYVGIIYIAYIIPIGMAKLKNIFSSLPFCFIILVIIIAIINAPKITVGISSFKNHTPVCILSYLNLNKNIVKGIAKINSKI